MDVLTFQRKWIDASRQKERIACATHFTDLGIDTPLDADPSGATSGCETGRRTAGGWPGDETPAEVAEDGILSRLLELNGERA